ncbi:hypothetical protein CDV31_004910 [Fusarium ambrosium]|uniref:SnoaL-like domain-containing protein n=1 Tax=Fusarium ambrosium TaxID=131363 RepID=A0A428UMG3_9HYPO|nr:hypothetical protein CDV31_004910 [Fusarium ambrosium]
MKSIYVIASLVAAVVAADTKSNCPPRPATKAQQKVIFEQAVQSIIIDGNYREGANKFYSEDYINHDPNVLSGRENSISFLESLPANINITIANKAIQGDYAYILQKVDLPGSPSLAWTDIWRLEGTCIMEHWSVYMSKGEDAVNPLPLV